MVTYSYATMDEAFLLDENLSILASKLLTPADVSDISLGKVSKVEAELVANHSDVVYCNYKHDESHNLVDYSLLQKIVVACGANKQSPRQEQYIAITAKAISSSVKWDTLLCQAIRSIDEIDKSINLIAKRLREWYEWHNPEFSRSVQSHEKFAEVIVTADRDQLLAELNLTASESMGAELEQKDLEPIMALASQVTELAKVRESTTVYIHEQMKIYLPNFTAIAGAQVGAKLLGTVGSVARLMKMTASTIQVLGAEKALFRHLKTGARPPKHGLLFQHPLVAKANPKNRGKLARTLANALSLAIRTDYFSPENRTFGVEKINDIEAKIKAGAF